MVAGSQIVEQNVRVHSAQHCAAAVTRAITGEETESLYAAVKWMKFRVYREHSDQLIKDPVN